MRSIFTYRSGILSLCLLFITCVAATNAIAQSDDAPVTYTEFYENLAPYGQWIEDPKLGFVFLPDVEADFRPYYTNGRWVMTNYGNTWISDYPWGWACFHYGRWTYDGYYGWLWVPGSSWGPAWVSWRSGDDHFGWAPLTPAYTFRSVYSCPTDWWVFIPAKYIHSSSHYRYWAGPRNNKELLKNSDTISNVYKVKNTVYIQGPRQKQVEEVTHKPVEVFRISHTANMVTRTHNDEIKMHRPGYITPAEKATPPNPVKAPQPVSKPEAMNAPRTSTHIFRTDVPARSNDAIGTHVNEVAKPKKQNKGADRPLDWDEK